MEEEVEEGNLRGGWRGSSKYWPKSNLQTMDNNKAKEDAKGNEMEMPSTRRTKTEPRRQAIRSFFDELEQFLLAKF